LVWLQHSLLYWALVQLTFLIVRTEPTPKGKQNPRPLNYEGCSMAPAFSCQLVTRGLGSIPAEFIWVYGRHSVIGTGSSLSIFFYKLSIIPSMLHIGI
jgi:hypothetical protein